MKRIRPKSLLNRLLSGDRVKLHEPGSGIYDVEYKNGTIMYFATGQRKPRTVSLPVSKKDLKEKASEMSKDAAVVVDNLHCGYCSKPEPYLWSHKEDYSTHDQTFTCSNCGRLTFVKNKDLPYPYRKDKSGRAVCRTHGRK